ncbi:Chloroperoxidase [Mycena floridula]|nr:Chloroperoxidase [Mycena floridula]
MRSITFISLLLISTAFALPPDGDDDSTDGKGRPSKTSSVSKPASTSKPTSSSISAPNPTTEVQDGVTGTLITLPTQPANNGLKQIPDADHPFIAPGPGDQRGPCPAMNTLANHGYIPRNGVATFEQLVFAQMEGFNLDRDFSANIAATNMLARGNPFTNQLSIGLESPLVAHIPFHLDGPGRPGGIAKHGRFEGDGSMTRQDANIGDNKDFQDILYDRIMLHLGKFGIDGPDGNNTVINADVLIAMEQELFARDQASNPKFSMPAFRMIAAYAEYSKASFVMNLFANGTTTQATMPIVGSFFRNQTFPPNWFRAASPRSANFTGIASAQVLAGVGKPPGRNNEQGVYVADPLPPLCYYSQMANTPAPYANQTGIFKKNVDLLTDTQATFFSKCSQKLLPFGPTGV